MPRLFRLLSIVGARHCQAFLYVTTTGTTLVLVQDKTAASNHSVSNSKIQIQERFSAAVCPRDSLFLFISQDSFSVSLSFHLGRILIIRSVHDESDIFSVIRNTRGV